MVRAVKARGFPFGRVISSEYCRCFESAELMDLGPEIEIDRLVTYFVYEDVILSRCAVASGLLSKVPAAGTNTAIVAHNYPDCIGSGGPDLGLENGQAAIFRPDGAGLDDLHREGQLRRMDSAALTRWAAVGSPASPTV